MGWDSTDPTYTRVLCYLGNSHEDTANGVRVQSWWWNMGGATPCRVATLTLVQL